MLAFLVLWLYWQVSSALLLLGALICLPNTTWLMWTYHEWTSRCLLGCKFERRGSPGGAEILRPPDAEHVRPAALVRKVPAPANR